MWSFGRCPPSWPCPTVGRGSAAPNGGASASSRRSAPRRSIPLSLPDTPPRHAAAPSARGDLVEDRLPTLGDDLPELVRAVLVDNADAILVVDAGGIVVAANPAASELFERPLEALLGSPLGHPIPGASQVEIEVHTASGPRHVDLHVGATTWRGETAHVVTLHNVTGRRRADEALRDFVAMTAHEVASPLTSILGFAETLQVRWDELSDPDRRRIIAAMRRQAGRLARLGRDLLMLARLDAEKLERSPRTTPVAACAREVVEEIDLVSDVDVEVDLDEGLAVLCDPAHLATILRNYLSNAVKYGQPPLRLDGRVMGSDLEIAVSNAGERVPDDFVAQLFTRFARASGHARGPVTGVGLGLALTAALAELNGGSVGHRHGESAGAVFWVRLPLADVPADPADRPASA